MWGCIDSLAQRILQWSCIQPHSTRSAPLSYPPSPFYLLVITCTCISSYKSKHCLCSKKGYASYVEFTFCSSLSCIIYDSRVYLLCERSSTYQLFLECITGRKQSFFCTKKEPSLLSSDDDPQRGLQRPGISHTTNVQYTEIYSKSENVYIRANFPSCNQPRLDFHSVSRSHIREVSSRKYLLSDYRDLYMEPAYAKFQAAGMLRFVSRVRYAQKV